MNITAIRIGKTFNTGNYTSKKVEIEAIPDNGQSFEEAMAQVNAIVDAQNPDAVGATTEAAPAKKTTTAPPLAGKGKTSAKAQTQAALAGKGAKPDKTDPSGASTSEKSSSTKAKSPASSPSETATTTTAPTTEKKKRGRPKKSAEVPGVDELLPKLKQTPTVIDMLVVFNDMRSVADRTSGEAADTWEQVCKEVAAHLRTIPGHTEQDGYADVVKAFDAEREALATARG